MWYNQVTKFKIKSAAEIIQIFVCGTIKLQSLKSSLPLKSFKSRKVIGEQSSERVTPVAPWVTRVTALSKALQFEKFDTTVNVYTAKYMPAYCGTL
jgi:hypothetical protein